MLGEMKNTGRKTGTCPVMKGKDTKSFYEGGVSVGSVKALRKKITSVGASFSSSFQKMRTGEGKWFNDPEMSLPRFYVSFWHSYFLF